MKRLFSFLLMIFLSLFLFSQDLPSIIPPSPEASSIGKFGQIPIGLFTGTPQIKVPLYTVENYGYKLPISLNYSSNGIKVNEISSAVGLGWNLSAGGVITRVLKDETDEDKRVSLPDLSIHSEEMKTFLSNVVSNEGMDTQADFFTFNFNGISGKFFLDENLQPRLIDPMPLKIEFLSNFTIFKITDSSGIEYYFGEGTAFEECISRTYGTGQGDQNLISEPITNAWYLTRIKLLNNEEISFSYDTTGIWYDLAISQSISAKKSENSNISGGSPVYTLAQHENPKITRQHNTFVLLNNVQWKSGNIAFYYSQRYEDFSTEFKKLDSVKIFNNHNRLIKTVKLKHSQYNTLSSFENPDHNGLDPTNSKRLFLDEILFYANEDTNNYKYSFEYYYPDQLPPRLTYAQDYWGYFNGKDNDYLVPKDLSLYSPSSYEDPEINYSRLIALFKNVGGNKSPDATFGIKGLLKKVTYPTGGFNEFNYEPHSYYGTEINYPPKESLDIHVETFEEQMGATSSSQTTSLIPFYQKSVEIDFYVGRTACWNEFDPDDKVSGTLSLEISDDGSDNYRIANLDEQFYSIDQFGSVHYSPSINKKENSPAIQYYIDLKEGKKYRFTVSLSWSCVSATMNTSYYAENYQEVNKNIEVGGLRIQQVTSDNGAGKKEVKKYHYGDLGCLDCSSADIEVIRPAFYFRTYNYIDSDANILETTVTLNSSTLNSIYDSHGYHLNYNSVIEEYGNNFSGGGVLHEYNTIFENPPIIIGDPIPGTSYSNGFGNAKEIRTVVFRVENDDYIKNKETIYGYKENEERLKSSFLGFTASVRTQYSAPYGDGVSSSYDFNLNKYYANSQWHYLNEVTELQYDLNGLNPVSTNTKYIYDNENHLQLTKEIVNDSRGRIIQKQIKYPQDIINPSSSILNLINKNRITIPVITSSFIDINESVDFDEGIDKKISEQLTAFKSWNNGIEATEIIQSSKADFTLENRIVYHDYDAKGNPIEVSKADGTHIVYIWGYNQTQPIAKIENATYFDVESALLQLPNPTSIAIIQQASDIDNDSGIHQSLNNDSPNEDNLRINLNKLRKALPNAIVTTFTYDPLIGITSITDPKGYIIYYKYDVFNRLEYIIDEDENYLNKYEYHYKNQTQQL